ncbi:MAG: hypothetical protein ACFB2W_13770 [Leptolyngbyaceae cyanobacterium]
MFSSASPNDRSSESGSSPQDLASGETSLPVEPSDDSGWQTVHFPGTIAANQLSGPKPHLRTNDMDSSNTSQSNSTASTQTSVSERPSQRETELLNLVRDLNECNDVLLAKVSQLEESLERSQTALQAEIDRAGPPPVGDRELVQLVTELEQSNQALQQYQVHNDALQTELTAFRERATHLETEHTELLRQHTQQSQELLQANTNCRDLRARLQRQQRYTLQFKAALEKCLSMSTEPAHSPTAGLSAPGIAMPTVEEIRPWESSFGSSKLDPQLESMIRGAQTPRQPAPTSGAETAAEDQLWHDLARVMDPADAPLESELSEMTGQAAAEDSSSQFTEPSPWSDSPSAPESINESSYTEGVTQLSPEAHEILARVQLGKTATAAGTYLPAMSASQSSPSPLVNPLKPQKRIGSLSAIDLPNFPKLKKESSQTKA